MVRARWFNESSCSSILGEAIATNTHLKTLDILYGLQASDAFYEGLKQNSSINKVILSCSNQVLVGGVFHEMLNVYQENNQHITYIKIQLADLHNGGDSIIINTLRRCTNLKTILLESCGLRDEHLLLMVDALRGHSSLEELHLPRNGIGNAGCEALATLLGDTNTTTLTLLNLIGNSLNIGVLLPLSTACSTIQSYGSSAFLLLII